jgi:hypothetical protein
VKVTSEHSEIECRSDHRLAKDQGVVQVDRGDQLFRAVAQLRADGVQVIRISPPSAVRLFVGGLFPLEPLHRFEGRRWAGPVFRNDA